MSPTPWSFCGALIPALFASRAIPAKKRGAPAPGSGTVTASPHNPGETLRPFPLEPTFTQAAASAAARHALSVLGERLMDLMAEAGYDCLAPIDRAGAVWTSHCATIQAAASRFLVLPGIDLGLILWTGSHDFHNGAMARSIAKLSRATGLRNISAIMLNLAATVSRYSAVHQGLRPLRPEKGIKGDLAASGPYLVMTRCTFDRLGNIRADEAFAQPVLSGRDLLPVTSDFDRDVIHLLLDIQDHMDDRGVALTVKRPLTAAGPARWIDAAIQVPVTHQACTVRVTPDASRQDGAFTLERQVVATPSGLADGSLTSQLLEAFPY